MHIMLPIKMFTFPRLMIVFLFALVIVGTYLHNKRVIDSTIRVYTENENNSDTEFWNRFGFETGVKKFLRPDPEGIPIDDIAAYKANLLVTKKHPKDVVNIRSLRLDSNGSDILVMLHIQKTGGTTFENHLVNMDCQPPCSCDAMPGHPQRPMCACLNSKGQNWMFNRHNVGWACGVHPDFTELTSCVEAWFSSQTNEDRPRKYHYITMVRDPIVRFISEWLHVRRGATWKENRLNCDGRDASLEEVPFCFKYGSWRNVTLEEFLSCSSNLAFNRQTRMLANLSLSDCYRLKSNLTKQQRDEIMLQSAKDNLANVFAFYGLTEYQRESQLLFEKTFLGLKFRENMAAKKTSFSLTFSVFSEYYWNHLVEKNTLDVRLYQYAKDLFFQRLNKAMLPIETKEREAIRVGQDFTYVIVDP